MNNRRLTIHLFDSTRQKHRKFFFPLSVYENLVSWPMVRSCNRSVGVAINDHVGYVEGIAVITLMYFDARDNMRSSFCTHHFLFFYVR